MGPESVDYPPDGVQSSSMVERAAVNRDVAGSSPASGAILLFCSMVESRLVGINHRPLPPDYHDELLPNFREAEQGSAKSGLAGTGDGSDGGGRDSRDARDAKSSLAGTGAPRKIQRMIRRRWSISDGPCCPRCVQRRDGSPPDASARRPYLNSHKKSEPAFGRLARGDQNELAYFLRRRARNAQAPITPRAIVLGSGTGLTKLKLVSALIFAAGVADEGV